MSTSKWVKFVRQCIYRRTYGDEFVELAEFLNEEYEISGKALVRIILECRQSFSISSDPLILQYIRAAVTSGLSQISDVLSVLIRHWNSNSMDHGLSMELKNPGCLSSPDSHIINDLTLVVSSHRPPTGSSETQKTLSLISRWLIALVGWISQDGENRSYVAILTLLEALGILLDSTISTTQGMSLLGVQGGSDFKSLVAEALETSLPLMHSISVQLHTRLDMIQKHYNLFPSETTKELDVPIQNSQSINNAVQFEANIVHETSVHARASLYVYMDAAVTGRPTVDDTSLMCYLSARYAGDHVSMFIDTIVAMFDVLSNSQARAEGDHATILYRSFLMNKLPLILCLISSSSLEPLPVNLCISQALGRIDLGAFPLSAYDMERRSSLAGIRQEFLVACALHRLIPEASIEDLLGENPMQTLPSHGLYEKDQLVQQIGSNAERGEQLIGETELLEGNAGAVVTAIIEVMHSHCRNKDTVQLKDLCNLIVRKPQVLDIMTMFKSPAFLLRPICSLLDNWNWDELHGESQPVYEEFGAILLLVLTVTFRYELMPFEIGITSTTSFIRQLLEMEATEQSLDNLDEAKRKHLGDWIAALFVADSLSDELTSRCSPHEFYKLLPTLLSQSSEACASGKLSIEALKSGFDYLMEPFLLPSLIVGLRWLVNHCWQTNIAAKISFSLLQSLMRPPSLTEAREIHHTVLSLVAEPLQCQLRAFGGGDLRKVVAPAIVDALSPSISLFRRNGWVSEEVQSLAACSGGFLASIRQTFHRLLDWSTSLEVNNRPPKFTFKLVSAAVHLHGASKVVLLFLEELKMVCGTTKFHVAVDIAASVMCAPFTGTHPTTHYLSLRDALKIVHADLAKILKKGESSFAEAVVRLHHRVEAFSAAVLQQQIAIDPTASMGQDFSNMDLQNVNLDAAAGNAEIDVGTLGEQPTSEDIDQILEGATGMENFGTNTVGPGTDDVFGLEGGDMQMMNFDDMDLEGMF